MGHVYGRLSRRAPEVQHELGAVVRRSRRLEGGAQLPDHSAAERDASGAAFAISAGGVFGVGASEDNQVMVAG